MKNPEVPPTGNGTPAKKLTSSRKFTIGLFVFLFVFVAASIVIPQYSCRCACNFGPENRIKANLQTVRSQLQLYKIQHNDQYPPSDKFIRCLLNPTTKDHMICNAETQDSVGPYLHKMPVNDYNNLATVEIATGDSGLGDSSHGWHYNTVTGEFNIDF